METPSSPFSNGSEHAAWDAVWCSFCVHDHAIHADRNGGGCRLISDAMFAAKDWRWPEAWTPEPPGMFGLPSYMLCGQFSPCHEGDCTGDPAPEERAERVTKVMLAWREATA